jgi:hypothetical protein
MTRPPRSLIYGIGQPSAQTRRRATGASRFHTRTRKPA